MSDYSEMNELIAKLKAEREEAITAYWILQTGDTAVYQIPERRKETRRVALEDRRK